MGTLMPGFFAHVDLGRSNLSPPSGFIDVSGLDFALTMCEGEAPVESRYTTWGMQTDSATLYQSMGAKNTIIIGDEGNIYRLDEDNHNDDGAPIPQVWETLALPEDTPEIQATSMKRLHAITWQTKDLPPSSGYKITVVVTDIDDTTNKISRNVTQTTNKMRVPIGLKARQWRIWWYVETSFDFDMISFGHMFQIMHRPYTKQTVR